MICPLLKEVGDGIFDPVMKQYLTEMDRDECLDDNCKYFEDCWGGKI